MLLELPQSTTAQANVLLARYWLIEPLMAHEFSVSSSRPIRAGLLSLPANANGPQDASAASLYLVAKMGASPRSTRDLANVYAYLLSPKCTFFRTGQGPPAKDPLSHYQHEDEYYAFQSRVLDLEARILYALSFNTHVELPHPLAVTYLQTLDFMGLPKGNIGRRAVEYLNTALLSPQMLYLTHQPYALATAAIYNAAKDLGAKMPECAWWEVFDVDREELGFLVVGMRSLEGWARQRQAELPSVMGGHMVTRRMVEETLTKQAADTRNGDQAGREEQDLMRQSGEQIASTS